MVRSLAVLMDAIESIKVAKDTSFALLLEAERRGYRIHYLTQGGLAIRDGTPWARLAPLSVRDDAKDWFTLGEATWTDLRGLDVILARKDPPVDAQFIYDTQVLQLAHDGGALVVNNPQGLRDANEKLFAQHGYHAVTIRQIAVEAEVPLALVGYYYGQTTTRNRAPVP